jgi:hypothetical protein
VHSTISRGIASVTDHAHDVLGFQGPGEDLLLGFLEQVRLPKLAAVLLQFVRVTLVPMNLRTRLSRKVARMGNSG